MYHINNLLHMIVCLPIKIKIDIYLFKPFLILGTLKGSDRALSKLIHQFLFQP